jgi:RNA polymerase primary sigma factor
MPVHAVEKLNRILRSERHLRAKDGRDPSSAEIALELEMSVVEVEQIRSASQTPVSLASLVGEAGDAELGDLLTDESDQLPDEQVESILRNETLRGLLETLPSRERQILERRYGLDGGDPATLDELARSFSITSERIRQLEKKSLTKLQVLARAASLDA